MNWTLVVLDWDGKPDLRLRDMAQASNPSSAFVRIVDLPSLKVHQNISGRGSGMVQFQIWVRTDVV